MQGPRLSSHYNRSFTVPAVPNQNQHDHQHDEQGDDNQNSVSPSNDSIVIIPSPSKLETIDSRDDRNNGDDEMINRSDYVPDSNEEEEEEGAMEKETVFQKMKRVVRRHFAFVGPGIIVVIAFIDPGNWVTDLQAGAQFGYAHLFIVLAAGLIALFYQILCARLGIITGMDLAAACRFHLHDRPRHKMLIRWGVLYPLYAICELGIIFTDIAELLGSAIAINLLIPQIPLPVCVVLTAVDVLLILVLFNTYPAKVVSRSMRYFELLITGLILVVVSSFIALLVRVKPNWGDVFFGYIPGPGIVANGGVYLAVGIIGATVMPHAFFIGSKIATVHRITNYSNDSTDSLDPSVVISPPVVPKTPAPKITFARLSAYYLGFIKKVYPTSKADLASNTIAIDSSAQASSDSVDDPDNKDIKSAAVSTIEEDPDLPRTLEMIRIHIMHVSIDIAISLITLAIAINSAILIVAAAVFFYGTDIPSGSADVADLFAAYDLVSQYVGTGFGYLFAIGLFAAGQAASLTVTLAGQIVSEGFIHWQTVPWKRRMITRAIGIIPSVAVAIGVGRSGINVLLVGSQVALSFVLPFCIAPLLIFTSDVMLMSVPIDDSLVIQFSESTRSPDDLEATSSTALLDRAAIPLDISRMDTLLATIKVLNPFRRLVAPTGHVTFANPIIVTYFGWFIWVVINVANIVGVYQLAVSG